MSICLRIIFAFVVALMWSAKGISSFAEGNTKLPPWYVEPKTRLPLQEYFADVEARVKRNWEPGYIFGNGDCEIHFTINPDGSFANIALIGGLGHPQTDFACVEAVSEASGFESLPLIVNEPLHKTLRLRPSERSVTCDCAKQFREINPRVSPQSIVWHLIPLEALQCCQTLSPDIVHSQKNLRLITNDLANGSEMSAARAEWAAFLHDNDNLTPEKITDEAERIERKYAAMFDRVPLGTDRTPENARLAYGYIDR